MQLSEALSELIGKTEVGGAFSYDFFFKHGLTHHDSVHVLSVLRASGLM